VVAGATVVVLAGGGVYAALGGFGQSGGDINLQKGLVGWWKLDGNTKDATPYGDDGTISGSTTLDTDRTGGADKAYSFDGSGSNYMSAPIGMASQPTTQITLSVWAKRAGSGSNPPRGIMISRNSTYIDNCLSGQVLFSLVLTTGQKLIYGGSCSAVGDWHLYTVTYDGATAKVYMDGAQVGSASYSDPLGTGGNILYLGRYNGGGYGFNGSLDDARLYNRALSAAEVKTLYDTYDAQTALASGEAGLVGHWKFDGNAKDATPYGDNGSVNGAVTAVADRRGGANSAYSFASGGWNYIAVSPFTTPAYPGLTLSAWIKPTAYPSERSTIIQGGNPNAYYLSLNSDGSVQTYWYGKSPEGYFSSGAGTVPLNQWSFVTATWDASNVRLYVNGQLLSTTASTGTGAVPAHLIFGAESAARQFVGSIDDPRVYNRALSTGEVVNLASSYESQINLYQPEAAAAGVNLTAGLVGYWPFSGNAKDATPYSRSSTVTGAVLTTDRDGRASSAYSFSGSGQYIDAGANPITGASPFTLAAWIDTSQVSRYSGALTIGASGGGTSAYIGTVNTAQVGTSNSIGGGFYGTNVGSGIATTGQWVHVAMTFDGTTGTMYVNGTATNTFPYTPALAGTYLRIGRIGSDTTYDFSGSIDDVRLYSRALSAAEVLALYGYQY
jgi:hypothetical protein